MSSKATIVEHSGLMRNLGIPACVTDRFLLPNSVGRRVIARISATCLPIEVSLFWVIDRIPVGLRHVAVLVAWKSWLSLHRILPKRMVQRGVSQTLSLEAHALGNVLWFVRLIPVTLRRARFSLNHLETTYPPSRAVRALAKNIDIPDRGVRGTYIHLRKGDQPRVLLFFYGGAYLGGSVKGSLGQAEILGRALDCDVFVTELRLCPEHTIDDHVADGCRAYEWLLSMTPPENIVFYGMSSGGGTALRVLQLAGTASEERNRFFVGTSPLPQPAGAVLCGPWVSYTLPPTKSMDTNVEIDWIVNQSVYELVFPMMGQMCGGEERRRLCSPLYQGMEGICPLFLSLSEHEVCTDENRELERKAKAAGVDIQMDLYPYMCHAFQFLPLFLPEAREAEARIHAWIKERPSWQS